MEDIEYKITSDNFLEGLNNDDKENVIKHLKISGEIHMWYNINSWLIDQVHNKKSIMKRTNYTIPDKVTNYYYHKYLFKGKKSIGTLSVFPSHFQSGLENVLYKSLYNKKFDFISVYYGHCNVPEELQFDSFNKNEWVLSEGFEMTYDDAILMEKYKVEFFGFRVGGEVKDRIKTVEGGLYFNGNNYFFSAAS